MSQLTPINTIVAGSSKSCVSPGYLRPILAQDTGRYDVAMKVQRSPAVIEAGMFLSSRDPSPMYLPPQWSASVHPEGKAYFYRDSGLRIVTDSYLYTPAIGEKICAWSQEVEKQAASKDFILNESVELFLQIEDDDCNYYFADHATQTLFWLEDLDTTELGLLPVISSSHLKLLLEAQYWTHVENFCMHFGGLPQKSIDDLILVFTHALADNLTSSLSTFLYDTPTCEKFLNLLTSSRDRIHDGFIVSLVARLWGQIMYNRYETHYGQEQARLSRDCSIIEYEQTSEIQWTKPVISLLSLKTSDAYLKRLDELYIDHYVYGTDWDSFMTSCVKGWLRTCCGSAGLLLLHVFCFFLPVQPVVAYISSALACMSLLTGALLIHRHEELEKAGATPAHEYLKAVCSDRFNFQGVALAYSLPKALFLWSLVAFLSQGAVLVCYLSCSTLAISAIILFLVAFQRATSTTSLDFSPVTRIFSRSKGIKEDASLV
ncbi:hypothetical protein B0H34DRAFT_504436 [Crassisporium funariophilum]|nr:hypothetical protein B0H34DRAFT_504436 [Crassisporium funariophilum]